MDKRTTVPSFSDHCVLNYVNVVEITLYGLRLEFISCHYKTSVIDVVM